ncbi:hypothetical protein LGH70_06095 [Hymenobacter sp. BT635]|uniref:Uncharacterized protein n=1 Tax=Hymenobacter nitidus TaxID=2880929 RepID=A0ABS8AAB0_9BACT|nr:contact-dependent growth inhibition system immunity protein [Hymenobacter nitidus]MCB2377144.1 hypothetical protein [Hymenobacter nitidus]
MREVGLWPRLIEINYINLHETLNELEGRSFLAEAPTELIRKCIAYKKLPIGDLSVEQLRLLIGQNIGLPYLLPLAINMLAVDPLLEGDFYEGDLLMSVLRVDKDYWKEDIRNKKAVKAILELHKFRLQNEGIRELWQAIKVFEVA